MSPLLYMQGPKEKCPHTSGPCYTLKNGLLDYRSKADGIVIVKT